MQIPIILRDYTNLVYRHGGHIYKIAKTPDTTFDTEAQLSNANGIPASHITAGDGAHGLKMCDIGDPVSPTQFLRLRNDIAVAAQHLVMPPRCRIPRFDQWWDTQAKIIHQRLTTPGAFDESMFAFGWDLFNRAKHEATKIPSRVLIHGDINHSNVIATRNNGVRLIDFGSAMIAVPEGDQAAIDIEAALIRGTFEPSHNTPLYESALWVKMCLLYARRNVYPEDRFHATGIIENIVSNWT